jgi:hypothetical protein
MYFIALSFTKERPSHMPARAMTIQPTGFRQAARRIPHQVAICLSAYPEIGVPHVTVVTSR